MMRHKFLSALVFTALTFSATACTAPANTSKSETESTIDMTEYTAEQTDVRKAVDELIQTATSYDVDTLDRIYHEKLEVIMLDTEDNLNFANKEGFKGLFRSKRDAGDPPMNTWAKYHNISVDGNNAHVLLSRKNDLSGQNMILTLSMDLVKEDGRWQIMREVILLRPESKS